MIRPDPERPHVMIVDVSSELLLELREGWSEPVQMMIEDDELVMRSLEKITTDVDPVSDDEMGRPRETDTVYRIPSSRGAEAVD